MAEYEVQLIANTFGGEGMGRLPDGRAVFVPFAMAGESVRLRLVEEKTRYARGELIEVTVPSPERVQPRCVHFGVCGGCHYQHAAYSHQLEMKRKILLDQLQRLGGFENPPNLAVTASPQEYGYRNHVQFHLDGAGRPGYHRQRSNEVVAIRECHLPVEEINALWPQLDMEAGGTIERLGLRAGSMGDVQVILESNENAAPELTVEDLPVSVAHLSPAGTLVLAGSPAVWMQMQARVFRVSAGSFFQVNLAVAEKMLDHILLSAGDLTGKVVLDLYSGVGLFSAFLAQQAARVIAVESSASACEDFVANLDEFDNVELYEAPVEALLESLKVKPGVMVADPPRAGLGRAVIGEIGRLQPEILIYVSCDPATMARDGRALSQSGYRLESLSAFDLFPQTYHIESIGVWRCD